MPIPTATATRKPPPSPYGVDPELERPEEHRLERSDDERDRHGEQADPEEEQRPRAYIRQDAVSVWPQERRRATRSGAAGRQGVRVRRRR